MSKIRVESELLRHCDRRLSRGGSRNLTLDGYGPSSHPEICAERPAAGCNVIGVRPLLLFDADCGFCTKVAGRVPSLRLAVEVAPLQSVDLAGLGICAERALTEMPYVDADGNVRYGHEAIAAALRTGPLPMRAIGRAIALPGVGLVARPVYQWIARHRHQLPGGTPACALPGADQPTARK